MTSGHSPAFDDFDAFNKTIPSVRRKLEMPPEPAKPETDEDWNRLFKP